MFSPSQNVLRLSRSKFCGRVLKTAEEFDLLGRFGACLALTALTAHKTSSKIKQISNFFVIALKKVKID